MKNLSIQSSLSEGFDRSDKLIAQLTNNLLREGKAVRLLKTIEDLPMLDDKVSRITNCLDQT